MKTGEVISLASRSTYAEVRKMLIEVMSTIRDRFEGEKAVMVELGLAEALNNIVEHAYKEVDQHLIQIEIARDEHLTCFTLTDRGVPNPTLDDVQSREFQPENLAEGGYGNNLIKTLASRIEYRRDKEKNVTKIWF